jgi:cell division GTPase FtsZ
MKPLSHTRAASDTRHRIALPNSLPRRIKLIGLGRGGGAVVDALDLAQLREVEVVKAAAGIDPARLAGAEMIFMVACAGDELGAAPEIKRLAREANVMTTGILLGDGDSHAGLPVLRAACDMLIVARDASYVADMLAQLGA